MDANNLFAKAMVGKLIRQMFAVLIAMVFIGAPVVPTMSAMPCHSGVTISSGHQLSSGTASAPKTAPCKGMVPGCGDMLGCGLSASLPDRGTAQAHNLIWTSASYRAVSDAHDGLSIVPDLGPPITI